MNARSGILSDVELEEVRRLVRQRRHVSFATLEKLVETAVEARHLARQQVAPRGETRPYPGYRPGRR